MIIQIYFLKAALWNRHKTAVSASRLQYILKACFDKDILYVVIIFSYYTVFQNIALSY